MAELLDLDPSLGGGGDEGALTPRMVVIVPIRSGLGHFQFAVTLLVRSGVDLLREVALLRMRLLSGAGLLPPPP